MPALRRPNGGNQAMSEWKYIMFEANGQQVPVIFPGQLIHSDMQVGAGHAIRTYVVNLQPNNWSSSVLSAGFISGLIVTGTYGKSESMGNVRSREEDRRIINEWPYAHGRDDGISCESMILKAIRRILPE